MVEGSLFDLAARRVCPPCQGMVQPPGGGCAVCSSCGAMATSVSACFATLHVAMKIWLRLQFVVPCFLSGGILAKLSQQTDLEVIEKASWIRLCRSPDYLSPNLQVGTRGFVTLGGAPHCMCIRKAASGRQSSRQGLWMRFWDC